MLTKFVVLCVFSIPSLCGAQESKADVSVNLNGLFPSQQTKAGITQKASDSGGVLVSFRYSPARFAAFEFNYAQARDTQYIIHSGVKSAVHTGVHEVSAAYVLHIPLHYPDLHPFALAGAGLMQINPSSSGTTVAGTQSQNKPALLWGVGADYDLSRHFALRLQYRGLFYAAPSFKVESLRTSVWQPASEPSLGVVYRF